jgi:hypothetical protein
MMRMFANKIALALTVAGLIYGAPGWADADTVSFNFDTIDQSLTGFSQPTMVKRFDPSLGTLESVEIEYTSKILATMTVTNTGSGKTTGTVDTEVQLTLADAKGRISQANDVATDEHSFSIAKDNFKTFPATGTDNASNTSDEVYTQSKILNEFSGMGKIDFTVTAGAAFANIDVLTGSASATASATADFKGVVVYTYIASVPEPSSLVLGAIGALGVSAVAIRRRAYRNTL